MSADLRAAAQAALDAMDRRHREQSYAMPDYFQAAYDALRAALDVPAQEPVYWQWRRKSDPWRLDHTFNSEVKATTEDSEVRALYAAPQQAPAPASIAQPLTRDEKHAMWVAATIEACSHENCYLRGIDDAERAHGIGVSK